MKTVPGLFSRGRPRACADFRDPTAFFRIISVLLTWLMLASSGGAYCAEDGADSGIDYYVTAEVDYTKLDIDTLSVNPQMTRLKFSGIMAKGIMKGVGLEVVAAVPLGDDEDSDLTVTIENHYGLYFSFADYRQDALNFTISLGFTVTDIGTELGVNGNKEEETLESGSFSASLQNSIAGSKNFFWLVDCTHYLKVGDIQMGGCGAGVKYGF